MSFSKYSKEEIMPVSRRKKLFSQPQTWFISSFNLHQVFKKRSWIIFFVEWSLLFFRKIHVSIFCNWSDEFGVTISRLAWDEKWSPILTCPSFAAIRPTLHFSEETRYRVSLWNKSMKIDACETRHVTRTS